MANPLARVVMRNISQMSGKVGTGVNTYSSSFKTANLNNREEQLLVSLLNKNGNSSTKVVNTSSSSYSTGRSNSPVNIANNLKTLDSLAAGRKNDSVENNSNTNNYNLNNNYENRNYLNKSTINTGSRNLVQSLSIDDLISGKDKKKPENIIKSVSKNKSGMMSLSDLAGTAKTSSDSNDAKPQPEPNVKNTLVRSSVLNNLETYIPKVTLDSIGKKGSLF
ncbi:hypothetical protein CLPU_29c00070 [Gottschalkia purinilytica]|uniref:Uncharacterized protein n=1 Tax=Gottschalkia purinilytica TaxID=1503 RepID=A0A0L0W689_GOTPU|nr:hypothetical protein [Gottschalkia purinilytica]KNF07043.1 hypothetical protein CLPU_29c00070 [Gottschalkia purinilytica]